MPVAACCRSHYSRRHHLDLYQALVSEFDIDVSVQVKAVAEAANATLKAFVGLLNPHAVKVVLPDFLAALDTKKNWQTKTAALASLGELTKRAPDQVNKCLPDIIPAVSAIMGDAKPQVKVTILSVYLSSQMWTLSANPFARL